MINGFTEANVPVVDARPTGTYPGVGPVYSFHRSYQHVKVLEGSHSTKLAAYNEGIEWVRTYQKADPLGNMACVIGVTRSEATLQFLTALKTFESAAFTLSKVWRSELDDAFCQDYPFAVSFDEIPIQLLAWREACEERGEYSAVVNYYHSNS